MSFAKNFGLHEVYVTADLHHLECERESLDEVLKSGSIIRHVQVAGGARQPPQLPGYDYSGFVSALATAGYDDRISAECEWRDLGEQAAPALEYMCTGWRDAVTLTGSDGSR